MIALSDKTNASSDIAGATASVTHDTLAEYPEYHLVYMRVRFIDNDQDNSSRTMRVQVESGGWTQADFTMFLKTAGVSGVPAVFIIGPFIAGGDTDVALTIGESDNPQDIDIGIRAWLLSDDVDYALSWVAAETMPTALSLTARIKTLGTDVTTLLGRVTATLFAGITSLGKWIGALAGKTADAPTLAEIQATTAGAAYNNVTDSQEAIRDQQTSMEQDIADAHDAVEDNYAIIIATQGSVNIMARGLVMHYTTIATLASQTSFTLTAGSPDDDAYVGCLLLVKDVTTPYQRCLGYVKAYAGATKTITLAADPGVFTMAVGDTVDIIPSATLAVWDELIAGHAIAGSTGAVLSAAAAGADPAAVADAVWDELIAGHADAGSMGALLSAIRAKTDLIGTVTVVYTSPAATGGTFAIVAGDDYLDADGRALAITVTDYSGPDLADATGVLRLVPVADRAAGTTTAELSVDAEIAVDGTTVTATIELTAAQTAAMSASPPAAHYNYAWQLRITTVGGTILTPAAGLLHVEPGVTA